MASSQPIESLGFLWMHNKALHASFIHTVAALKAYPVDRLMDIPGIGWVGDCVIKQALYPRPHYY